jgi:hypothetical protein
MKNTRGWIWTETIGFSIVNPRSCFKISGSPEKLRKLLLYIKENFPEQLDQRTIEELEREENGRT